LWNRGSNGMITYYMHKIIIQPNLCSVKFQPKHQNEHISFFLTQIEKSMARKEPITTTSGKTNPEPREIKRL
jgi:hypothetical protein